MKEGTKKLWKKALFSPVWKGGGLTGNLATNINDIKGLVKERKAAKLSYKKSRELDKQFIAKKADSLVPPLTSEEKEKVKGMNLGEDNHESARNDAEDFAQQMVKTRNFRLGTRKFR